MKKRDFENIQKKSKKFIKSVFEKCLEEALYAKFSQKKDFTELLKDTNNAKLLIYKKGSDPEVAKKLMKVRNKLQRESK